MGLTAGILKAEINMKERILEFLKTQGGNVSFAEMSNRIEGFKGDMSYGRGDLNIWIWFSMSEQAAEALEELSKEKSIVLTPCSAMVYMCDGIVPSVPIAKKTRRYKTMRWAPTVLNLA